MKPLVIGITMCIDQEDRITKGAMYNYVRRTYGQAVAKAGGQPIFIDPSINPWAAAELCDGIVISGGEDIDPSLYGQAMQNATVLEPRERTDWERQLIDTCNEWDVPILGVCYGSQLLNVHYGGTLHQDVGAAFGEKQAHGSSAAPVRHRINFELDLLGFHAGDAVYVEARHHQAVNELGTGMVAVARANDGCIEAIAGNGHFGVQWHPESDETALMIYGGFVSYCQQRRDAKVRLRRPLLPAFMTQWLAVRRDS